MKCYDVYLTENDVGEIINGETIKRFVGEYIIHIKRGYAPGEKPKLPDEPPIETVSIGLAKMGKRKPKRRNE